mmetsp:Transcript_15537/g.40270  ORF Transcript_15537/g.40270 Transcript_15537/m.40270 type:complete len:193 (+) Transcript_15537:285-863(+)
MPNNAPGPPPHMFDVGAGGMMEGPTAMQYIHGVHPAMGGDGAISAHYFHPFPGMSAGFAGAPVDHTQANALGFAPRDGGAPAAPAASTAAAAGPPGGMEMARLPRKKLARKEKNRQAAARSRKRKQTRMQELEAALTSNAHEIESLKATLADALDKIRRIEAPSVHAARAAGPDGKRDEVNLDPTVAADTPQ